MMYVIKMRKNLRNEIKYRQQRIMFRQQNLKLNH